MQGALKVTWLPATEVQEISNLVIRQMTFFSLDYLEHPEQRDAIRAQAERFVLLLFLGAIATRSPAVLAAAKVNLPPA